MTETCGWKSAWTAMALAPFLVHAVVVASLFGREPAGSLEWLDLAVLGLTTAWLIGLVIVFRRGPARGRFLIASWSVLLAIVMCEVAARLLYPPTPPGLPMPPMAITAEAADTMEGISGRIDFTVNRLGVRGPEVDLNAMDLKILCVGGSTTQCRYVTDHATWPWKLQDDLSERLDRPVFVGNAAKPGHFSVEHDLLLQAFSDARRFDWVVALCGLNDIQVNVPGGRQDRLARPQVEIVTSPPAAAPWHAYYRGSAIARVLRPLSKRMQPNVFVEDAAGEWYREARLERRRALERRTLTEPPPNLPELLDLYRQDLRNLIATCGGLEVKLLLLTQPTRFARGLPPEVADTFVSQHHTGAFTPEAYAELLDAYNGVLLEVAAEEGVPAIDLASMLPKDGTVFYDDCHFNISGCAQVAAILVEFFAGR
ncbi:MAG: SGNH/GDSL hydrolase family protein [Planctomycetaceae bacterium]